MAELARAERERDVAHAARAVAEDARDRAEIARDAAEAAGDAARAEVAVLEEALAFLREQLQSTRDHAAEAAGPELADLRAECEALLCEVTLLDAEMRERGSVPAVGALPPRIARRLR